MRLCTTARIGAAHLDASNCAPSRAGRSCSCPRCHRAARPCAGAAARPAALAHLARHARTRRPAGASAHLPVPRTRAATGIRATAAAPARSCSSSPANTAAAVWRLADACAACAAATRPRAVVPDPPSPPLGRHLPVSASGSSRGKRDPTAARPGRAGPRPGLLSYLAAALPPAPPRQPGCSPCNAPCAPTPRAMSSCPSASCAACAWPTTPRPGANSNTTTGSTRSTAQPARLARVYPRPPGRRCDPGARPPRPPPGCQLGAARHRRSARESVACRRRLAALALEAHCPPSHPHSRRRNRPPEPRLWHQPAELDGLLDRLVTAGAMTALGDDPHTDELRWSPCTP